MNGRGSRSEKRPVCQRLANPALALKGGVREVAERRRACGWETAKTGLGGADEIDKEEKQG